MDIYIKNMVCSRCVHVVRTEAERLNIRIDSIELGALHTHGNIDPDIYVQLHNALHSFGFEVIDDNDTRIVNDIKTSVIELVQLLPEKHKLSTFLAARLDKDYTWLSKLFSETESKTIEQYFIELRIERAKELLMYAEHTLSEIAYILGYSSVAHLSSQFKKVAGLTPSFFKRLKIEKRKFIDRI